MKTLSAHAPLRRQDAPNPARKTSIIASNSVAKNELQSKAENGLADPNLGVCCYKQPEQEPKEGDTHGSVSVQKEQKPLKKGAQSNPNHEVLVLLVQMAVRGTTRRLGVVLT